MAECTDLRIYFLVNPVQSTYFPLIVYDRKIGHLAPRPKTVIPPPSPLPAAVEAAEANSLANDHAIQKFVA